MIDLLDLLGLKGIMPTQEQPLQEPVIMDAPSEGAIPSSSGPTIVETPAPALPQEDSAPVTQPQTTPNVNPAPNIMSPAMEQGISQEPVIKPADSHPLAGLSQNTINEFYQNKTGAEVPTAAPDTSKPAKSTNDFELGVNTDYKPEQPNAITSPTLDTPKPGFVTTPIEEPIIKKETTTVETNSGIPSNTNYVHNGEPKEEPVDTEPVQSQPVPPTPETPNSITQAPTPEQPQVVLEGNNQGFDTNSAANPTETTTTEATDLTTSSPDAQITTPTSNSDGMSPNEVVIK